MLHTLCNTFSHYSQPQTVTHTVVLALGAPHIPEQSLPPIKQPSNTVVSDAITTNTCSTELFAIISSMQITPEVVINAYISYLIQYSNCLIQSFGNLFSNYFEYRSLHLNFDLPWEKPDEFILFQQQLQKQQKLQNASQQPHFRSTSLCGEVDQMQKALLFYHNHTNTFLAQQVVLLYYFLSYNFFACFIVNQAAVFAIKECQGS